MGHNAWIESNATQAKAINQNNDYDSNLLFVNMTFVYRVQQIPYNVQQ